MAEKYLNGGPMRKHVMHHCASIAMLSLVVAACSAETSGSQHGIKAGFDFSDQTTAESMGLRTYPGAKPFKKPGDSSSSADIGLSTPLFGLKVVAVKLQSEDRPEQIAAFYLRELSKYGNVLKCTGEVAVKGKSQADDELNCDSSDGTVYKVGTKQHQRIVSIKSNDAGTQFDLVYVDTRGS